MSCHHTPFRRARAAVWAAAAPLALALLLAGCPQPEEALPPDPPPEVRPEAPVAEDPEPVDPATDPGNHMALDQSCTNQTYGFRVQYPAGWVVNQANGLPPCSAFDPHDAGMPAAADIPTDIAIVIHRDDVAFGTATDFAADFTVEALSRREAMVDGRAAVVAELEHTGDGMYPAGHRFYAYFVDRAGRTLVGMTHDVDGAGPSAYDERRRILDRMMDSLSFQ